MYTVFLHRSHVFVQTDWVHFSPSYFNISVIVPSQSNKRQPWQFFDRSNCWLTKIKKILFRSAGRARAVFCILFLLLLAAWSSLLIGDLLKLFGFFVKTPNCLQFLFSWLVGWSPSYQWLAGQPRKMVQLIDPQGSWNVLLKEIIWFPPPQGVVFTFRVNREGCEMCPNQAMCR